MSALATRAPAKINLTLHVLGRRADGYHDLESLVAFASTGDDLRLVPGTSLSLDVTGPTAPLSGDQADNLVLKAARLLAARIPGLSLGHFHLVKRLPVAAGMGGGSSDAAAALRLIARLNDLPLTHPAIVETALATGADVPVCIEAKSRMMRGIGDMLGIPLRLPRLHAVLINPRVGVATPEVFRALALKAGEAGGAPGPSEWPVASQETLIAALSRARNDLQPPALALLPTIREALLLVERTQGCRLTRMSGSGATVFGLFDTGEEAANAAKSLRAQRPAWWVRPTILR